MLTFHYKQEENSKIQLFPHIRELGVIKNPSILLHAFSESADSSLNIFYICEGRFEWIVNGQPHLLYPGDSILVLPGQKFGHEKAILEIGTFYFIKIKVNNFGTGGFALSKWNGLTEAENAAIGKTLHLNTKPVLSKYNEVGRILNQITNEINQQDLGYFTRVNQLTDELIITISRQFTKQFTAPRDFTEAFMRLDEALRNNLSHQWTVEEMAAIAYMSTTMFNEKVKAFSGFTPLNYLINLRVSEAIKLLKKNETTITDIALETGFYSSQHFSTTFKKLTGYTPGEFRKNNITSK